MAADPERWVLAVNQGSGGVAEVMAVVGGAAVREEVVPAGTGCEEGY